MQVVSDSLSTPIFPGYVARISSNSRHYKFGTKPFAGLSGCGCGPVDGCNCTKPMSGFGQNASLDQIINNAFNWLSGTVQAHLPPSASVPPQYGSTGGISTSLQSWIPWVVGGLVVYAIMKK